MTNRAERVLEIIEQFQARNLHVEAGWSGLLAKAPGLLSREEFELARTMFFAGAIFMLEDLIKRRPELMPAVEVELRTYIDSVNFEAVPTVGNA
jgi:hypothetical protein